VHWQLFPSGVQTFDATKVWHILSVVLAGIAVSHCPTPHVVSAAHLRSATLHGPFVSY